MSDPQPDPTPEPVQNAAAVKAWLLRLLGGVALLTAYYEWWTPSGEELLMLAGVGAVIAASIEELIARFVRKRVTPNEKVALTVADARLLHEAGVRPSFPVPAYTGLTAEDGVPWDGPERPGPDPRPFTTAGRWEAPSTPGDGPERP